MCARRRPSPADTGILTLVEDLYAPVLAWYAAHARDLPWRRADRSAWGVLVSEIMLQQTPVRRVLEPWRAWMTRWPAPAALAAATAADAVVQWGRLGYPRRALRLREAAVAIVGDHGGGVPDDVDALRALPGVGTYTAAAVAAFAYGKRVVVLDTNVRRVLARAVGGEALPPPAPTADERQRAEGLLPADPAESASWNAAVMELGALVCQAATPLCADCPIHTSCAWVAAGQPPDAHAARRRAQPWAGTDRQVRGIIMAALRARREASLASLRPLWPDDAQLDRAVASLVADGLAERSPVSPDALRLPGIPARRVPPGQPSDFASTYGRLTDPSFAPPEGSDPALDVPRNPL